MKFEIDTLRCVKMLTRCGLKRSEAQAIIESLSAIEINNLYAKTEVDTMLSESFYKTVDECRRDFDKRLEQVDRRLEQSDRQVNKRLELSDKQFDKWLEQTGKRFESSNKRLEAEISDARAGRRWMIGIIITSTLGLAGYLSALIRLTH